MTPSFIIEVTEADFEFEVIQYSLNTPVVVDFWAEWCRPCLPLREQLESLAHEAQGSFRLAMVNADSNPNLAVQFGVRSLPTVKAFSGGRVVAEFVGQHPPERIREFIRRLQPPTPAALLIEKGNSLMGLEDWSSAVRAYEDALRITPGMSEALFGIVRGLIMLGKGYDASELISAFPASRYYLPAQELLPLAEDVAKWQAVQDPAFDDPNEAIYWRSISLIASGKAASAMDGLLSLLREDRSDKHLRKVILALLEVMGEYNSQTEAYRREFSSIVF